MIHVVVELDDPFFGPNANPLLAETIHVISHLRFCIVLVGIISGLGLCLIDFLGACSEGPCIFDLFVKTPCVDNSSDSGCDEKEWHQSGCSYAPSTLFLVNTDIFPQYETRFGCRIHLKPTFLKQLFLIVLWAKPPATANRSLALVVVISAEEACAALHWLEDHISWFALGLIPSPLQVHIFVHFLLDLFDNHLDFTFILCHFLITLIFIILFHCA